MFQNATQPRVIGDGPAEKLCQEDERLSVLGSFGLDGLSNDEELGRVAGFAARLCNVPIAMVSIVEEERQRFLANEGLDVTETPRPTSFCAHAMLQRDLMVVPDATKDSRFLDNPLVTGDPDIRFYTGAPLVSAEGAPLGAICVIDCQPRPEGLTDLQIEGLTLLADGIMRRLEARRAAMRGEERFALLADNMPDMAWSCDAEGNFDFYNVRWSEFTGSDGPREAEGWRDLIHPEDQEESFARWDRSVEAGTAFESEYRMRRKDGEWRWVISRALPLREGGDGSPITRWFGTITDIDETRDLSDARDLLSKELSHRIKNIFAVVSGLVALRARSHPESGEFAKELGETLRALGRAHDYVQPFEGRRGDNLRELLADLVAPYQDAAKTRIAIEGADVAIGNKAATPLALIFHELATNSAKYGALSCDSGRVKLVTEQNETDRTAIVRWTEFAGPCPAPPDSDREGFGSRLLRLAVEGQLGGEFDRHFNEDGLVCELRIPAAVLEERSA